MRELLLLVFLLSGCEACTFEVPDRGLSCIWQRGPDIPTNERNELGCFHVVAANNSLVSTENLDPCDAPGRAMPELVVPNGTLVYAYYEPALGEKGEFTVKPVPCPE